MKNDEIEKSEEIGEKKVGKTLIIFVVGILSVVLIVSIVFGMSYFKRIKTIKQADGLIAIERYEDGIAIYDNLLSKKYSLDIINKRSSAFELMEANENLKKGIEASEENDINKAVRYLLKVPKEDAKRYELALEELSSIEETILIDIEQLIEYENLDEAKEVANSYLKVDSKNVKVQNIKNAIEAQEAESEKQARMEKENEETAAIEAVNKAESEAEIAKKNAEARSAANSIIGSYRTIIAENANLRDAPSLKGEIIGVLSRGTNVYIYDTQIESADRIWCHISVEDYGYTEYGWVSYNTLNYKIQ